MEQNKPCSNTHPCECGGGCPRHQKCCECVAFHKAQGNLPVCLRGLKKD